MRIQRLKDKTLWIAAANGEEVDKIIISAGTWSATYDRRRTPEEYLRMMMEKPEPDGEAEWINLGHRIEPFAHPYSEYWKCSRCGHEQYVIGIIPDICPNCHAKMKVRGRGWN